MITYFAYAAIAALGISYWFQVWKIQQHKEVRDISIGTFVLLLCGYSVMLLKAAEDGSSVFFWRQVATIVPVSVILFQIWYHRKDRWHDDEDPYCANCQEELEPSWQYCPFCSNSLKKRKIQPCAEYHMVSNDKK